MTNRMSVNKFVICLTLIAFVSACTTMHTLPATDAQSLASQLDIGDKVKIVRNDLTEVTFEVSDISNDGIRGDGVFVAYSDIRQVQVSQANDAKDTLYTLGLIVLVALVLGASGTEGGY